MEDRIREYEKYIEKKANGPLGPIERVKLAEFHKETVANFQWERIIHLLVTFFFGVLTIIAVITFCTSIVLYGFMIEFISLYALTFILVVLEFFYVKHYYFLENHIQGLYKYDKIIRMGKNE